MAATPDYNQDSPPTLFAAGTLQGKAVGINPSSIRPCDGRPIFLASLSSGAALERLRGGSFGVIAVKSTADDGSRVPRNPRREARLLAKLSHPNTLSLLNAYQSDPSPTSFSTRISLFTPFYPHTLRTLLSSPSFSLDGERDAFCIVSRSLAFQLVSAVDYIHAHGVAHRDLNPNNVVISDGGRAVIIDYGIAIEREDEPAGEMHHEVGTGSYRPPELVFASRDYDPFAVDLWALGATLSEFFAALELPVAPSPDSEDEFERYYRQCATPPPEPTLQRKTLFDGGASDFLLAASIFRVLGTPTSETWPESASLPNFARFTFAPFPPTPLASHLPHLEQCSALARVLAGMLVISASGRMPARTALDELKKDGPVSLPDDFDSEERRRLGVAEATEIRAGTLGKALAAVLQAQ